jgi:O-antigen/teichoic acid export membrane protein
VNLAGIQLLSLTTKAITTTLGIIQSIIVVRILSPAEFGLVGLAMAIGTVVGVSQHLGIVDGAIREIAVRKKKEEIGKVFWVSNITRQAVTIPLSLLLMLLARPVAEGIYGRPEITPYIYMFASILILQGVEGVFGATLTGLKKFVSL